MVKDIQQWSIVSKNPLFPWINNQKPMLFPSPNDQNKVSIRVIQGFFLAHGRQGDMPKPHNQTRLGLKHKHGLCMGAGLCR